MPVEVGSGCPVLLVCAWLLGASVLACCLDRTADVGAVYVGCATGAFGPL